MEHKYSEKDTDRIMFNYIKSTLNIEYNTGSNKELFDTNIPDGWYICDDNLLIIENKVKLTRLKYKECLEQLKTYCSLAYNNNNALKMYCCACFGTNIENIKIYYFKYNNLIMEKIQEQDVINIFNKPQVSINLHNIHNAIVNSFKVEKSSDIQKMLCIIVISFVNNDIIEIYEKKDKENIINTEFKKLLLDNAKSLISSVNEYNKQFSIIENTDYKNVFSICQNIYKAYKQDNRLITNLFKEFEKYNYDEFAKNEIWTEEDIVNIMFNELKPFCDKILNNNKQLTILDPCIGGCNLITPFINKYSNKDIIIKGCDINQELSLISKFDLIINGLDCNNVYCCDFMKAMDKHNLKADVCICNPPYSIKNDNITKNSISKYYPIEFLEKATSICDYCCFIFPASQININKNIFNDIKKKILEKHNIYNILQLGNNIFKNVGTGDIIIITTISKKLYKNTKTNIYDITMLSNKKYRYFPMRSNRSKLTQDGEILCKNIIDNKKDISVINKELIYNTPWLNTIENSMNNKQLYSDFILSMIENYKRKFNDEMDIIYNNIINNEEYNGVYTDIYNELSQYTPDNMTFVKYKLSDILEEVKVKKYTISKTTEGDVPLYSATMDDKPIKYISEYSVNDDNEYITINKDGSAGYCYRRKGKFAITTHVKLFIPKINISNINLSILSKQLNKIFSFSNSLNKDRFEKVEVYILDDKYL